MPRAAIELAVEQPWLLDRVDEPARPWVRRNLLVPLVSIPRGPFAVEELPRPEFGMIVVEGRLLRRLHVGPYRGAELLGETDILRVWTDESQVATIPAGVEWRALTDIRFALLDHRFLQVARQVPEVMSAVLDRSVERTRMMAFFLTLRGAVRIEDRLLLTLWHLAERWGKVTAEGVVLPLPKVTHDILGEMLGSRRPSVSAATARLEQRGALERRPGGVWVLKGEPPVLEGAEAPTEDRAPVAGQPSAL